MAGTNILVRQKDLIAGSGISITPDTTSGNVTIAATNTAIDEARLLPTGGKNGNILEYQEGADRGNGNDVRLLLQSALTDSASGNAAPAAVTTQGVTLTGDKNLLFDGNDSHVTAVLATDEIFAADKEWTIDFWMKPTANSSEWNYILTENRGDWGSHSIGLTWNKSKSVLEQDTGGYVASVIKAPNWPNNSIACAANEWHFVAVEKQKTASGWSLNYYLNGAIWLQVAFTGNFVPFDTTNPFWFGGKTTDGGRWFKGEANKLRVTAGARYGGKAFAVPERLTDYAAPAGQPVWAEGIDRSRLLKVPTSADEGKLPVIRADKIPAVYHDTTLAAIVIEGDKVIDKISGKELIKVGSPQIIDGGIHSPTNSDYYMLELDGVEGLPVAVSFDYQGDESLDNSDVLIINGNCSYYNLNGVSFCRTQGGGNNIKINNQPISVSETYRNYVMQVSSDNYESKTPPVAFIAGESKSPTYEGSFPSMSPLSSVKVCGRFGKIRNILISSAFPYTGNFTPRGDGVEGFGVPEKREPGWNYETLDEAANGRLLPANPANGDIPCYSNEPPEGVNYNDANTVLLLQGSSDNTAAASTSERLNGIVTGEFPVQSDGSLLVTGSSNYITFNDADTRRVFSGEFTLETYIKTTQFTASGKRQDTNWCVVYRNGGSVTDYQWLLLSDFYADAGKFGIWPYPQMSGETFPKTLVNAEFQHVAIDVYMVDGVRKFTMYRNGVPYHTGNYWSTTPADWSSGVSAAMRLFGEGPSGGDDYLSNASVMSLRVSNVARYKGVSFDPPADGKYLTPPAGYWGKFNKSELVVNDARLLPDAPSDTTNSYWLNSGPVATQVSPASYAGSTDATWKMELSGAFEDGDISTLFDSDTTNGVSGTLGLETFGTVRWIRKDQVPYRIDQIVLRAQTSDIGAFPQTIYLSGYDKSTFSTEIVQEFNAPVWETESNTSTAATSSTRVCTLDVNAPAFQSYDYSIALGSGAGIETTLQAFAAYQLDTETAWKQLNTATTTTAGLMAAADKAAIAGLTAQGIYPNVAVAAAGSGIDYNLFKTQGTFYIPYHTAVSNGPVSAGSNGVYPGGFLSILQANLSGGTSVQQIFHQHASNNAYIRSYNGDLDIWTDWVKLIVSTDQYSQSVVTLMDFNDYRTPGGYFFYTAAHLNSPDAPNNTAGWLVIEVNSGGEHVKQTYYALSTRKTYIRTYNNNNQVWLPWLQQLSVEDIRESKTSSGYFKLPGGTIVQWGEQQVTAGSYTKVVFPIVFPTAFVSGTAIVYEADVEGSVGGYDLAVSIGGGTVSGMSVYAHGDSVGIGAIPAKFIAIGY